MPLPDRTGGPLGEAALALYEIAGRLLEPLAGRLLDRRASRGKEDPARRAERFGRSLVARPPGPLVWVHAASVGETAAMLPLVERLSGGARSILLTTGTVTAAGVAARRLPASAIHQYVPIDTPQAVGRFLDHWRPDLALFAESELWPATLRALSRRNLPLVLVNARMSPRSFRGWRALAPVARAMMGRVDLVLARSAADAARLRALGAARVAVTGNLKFDAPPLAADEETLAELRRRVGSRPVLVAASTHAGEEAALSSVHHAASGLLTILAPRHPERGDAVEAELAAAGLRVRRRSRGEMPVAETDIYLADTIGEMGTWYRLADMAFLGGSLVPRGGQNPIEPAKLMVPVLHGPHVRNFVEVYEALAAAAAVVQVRDAGALAGAVARLCDDPGERRRLAAAAAACVAGSGGVLDRTLGELRPWLARLNG